MAEKIIDVRECNKMSWQKCNNCEFLMDITTCSGIAYLCQITGETLKLTNCKHCDERGDNNGILPDG